jgi:hypothetical protein
MIAAKGSALFSTGFVMPLKRPDRGEMVPLVIHERPVQNWGFTERKN